MSLATRCTHCGTTFKVVQDQLKVSEGWVRCGRCNEVFNAMPALFDLATEAAPPKQVPPAPAQAPHPLSISDHTPLSSADLAFPEPTQAVASTAFTRSTPDFDLDTEVDLSDPHPSWSPPAQAHTEAPPPASNSAPSPNAPEFADARFPLDAWESANKLDWPQHQDAPAQPEAEPPSPPLPASLPTPSIEPHEGYLPEQLVRPPSQRKGRSGTRGRDAAPQPPEFVRQAQRQAFWRRPAVLAIMGLMSLLLSIGLLAQIAHHFRDQIAAHTPSTRAMLHAWCSKFGCEIHPVKNLESLQVESATLMRTLSEGPDRYRLTVIVRNRNALEPAWPHINLSLTDDHGNLIARRALAPRDAQVPAGEGMPMLSAPQAVPAGESTQLQWPLRLKDLSPTGYTAELFYP